jgi:four helix bundle protein
MAIGGKIRSFTDLEAWKEAHRLVLIIYNVTKLFPKEEMYGLKSQMQRAAVSVSSNIAEEFRRGSLKDKGHFYTMAAGSITELQNQAIIVRDIKYIVHKEFQKIALQTVKVHKLINGLIKYTKNNNRP